MAAVGAHVASVIQEIRQHYNVKDGKANFRVQEITIGLPTGVPSPRRVSVAEQKIIIESIYKMYNLDIGSINQRGTIQMMVVLLTAFKHQLDEVMYGTSTIMVSKAKPDAANPGKSEPAKSMNITRLGCSESYANLFTGVNHPPMHRSTMGNSTGIGTQLWMYRIAPKGKFADKWLKLIKFSLSNYPHATAIAEYFHTANISDLARPWAIIGQLTGLGRTKTVRRASLPLVAFIHKLVESRFKPAMWGADLKFDSITDTNVGYGWDDAAWAAGNPKLGDKLDPNAFNWFDFSGRGFTNFVQSLKGVDFYHEWAGSDDLLQQWMFLAMYGCAYEDMGVMNAMTEKKFKQRAAYNEINKKATTVKKIQLLVPKYSCKLLSTGAAFNQELVLVKSAVSQSSLEHFRFKWTRSSLTRWERIRP